MVLALAACGGDDDDGDSSGPPTTAAEQPPATLPEEVDAGRGAMVLDGEGAVLTVTSCDLEPSTDPATGVTTELAVQANDGTRRVDIVRSSFTADVPTVTDTISVIDADESVLESSRVDRDGLLLDIRLENPVGPLLDVDADAGLVHGEGVFGPVGGTTGDAENVDGELLLRCP